MVTKIIISAILLIVLVIFGRILHRNGKPYNAIWFNIHKLVALGLVVFIAIIATGFFSSSEVSGLATFFIITAIVSALVLFISGALLSADKLSQEMLVIVHRIFSALICFSICGIFFFILKGVKI